MKRDDQHRISVERRRFLKLGAMATVAIALPRIALADPEPDDWTRITEPAPQTRLARLRPPAPRTGRSAFVRELSIYNVHTDESLRVAYWENGDYVPGALHDINYLFRDFRANEVKAIDPRLLDVLYDVHNELGTSKPYDLVSGYRTALTNAMLAASTEGVATHSMHIQGKAADVHVPGVELAYVQRAALSLAAGGVGYYPRSGFVHIDTGRVRRW